MNLGYMINGDDFIALFIALKQVELSMYQYNNLLDTSWSFNIEELNRFICYSQRNPKYIALLQCFDVVIDNAGTMKGKVVNIRLMVALNRAYERHLLTAIDKDTAYISRAYMSASIIRNYEYLEPLMKEFIADFNTFALNPTEYVDNLQMVASSSEQTTAFNERAIYNLQRKMRFER